MKRFLFTFDLVVLGYIFILSTLLALTAPPRALVFFAYHLAAGGLMALAILGYQLNPSPFWTFVRYWYPTALVTASFRELHYLIPLIHNFDDYRFDKILLQLDQSALGDIRGFISCIAHPFLIDVLHLCYWSYFLHPFILGLALFRRQDRSSFRRALTGMLMAWYVSFLGYIVVPAVGPQFLEPPLPERDGWVLGAFLHSLLVSVEWRMADAFPSGHTLVILCILTYAWRFARKLFPYLFPAGCGLILATLVLRYHYAVDVAASFVLWPLCVLAADTLCRCWETPVISFPPPFAGARLEP